MSTAKKLDENLPFSDASPERANIKEADLVAVPLTSIRVSGALPYPVFVRIADYFIMFRPTGDVISNERFAQLQESLDTVFIPRKNWHDYLRSLEEDSDHIEGSDEEVVHLRNMILAFQRTFNGQDVERITPKEMEKMRALGTRLAMILLDSPKRAGSLLQRYEEKSLYFLNHNVNVAVYCAAVGLKLNLSPKDIKSITSSALTHNIGNIFIPDKILFKEGDLTQQEWALIQVHPKLGAELLGNLRAPKEMVLTALQHHEQFNGEGYPKKVDGAELHLFAKICAIADVYDALTNGPPYRDRREAQKAVEKMRKMIGKFDPALLNMMSKK